MFYPFHSGRDVDSNNYKKGKKKKEQGYTDEGKTAGVRIHIPSCNNAILHP